MKLLYSAALGAALLTPLSALAHDTWLLPSKTVLATGQWVTVDAAASTQPFIKDHAPLRLNSDNLHITAPDGSAAEAHNLATGKLRSTFDLQLEQEGTYKIAVLFDSMMASWQEGEQRHRWPPRGGTFSAAGLAKQVPPDATKLRVTEMLRRMETYVTAGQPDNRAHKPTGKGLELVPVTPFNDLYSDEPATFQLLLDGQPASDQPIKIVADGLRYRDAVQAIKLTTDKDGRVIINWPGPGMYWMNTSLRDNKATKPATERSVSFTAILEVLSP